MILHNVRLLYLETRLGLRIDIRPMVCVHPASGIFPGYFDLAADKDVELVDIATRSVDHFQHARIALEAGKYVFQEKPFAETHEEARKLMELCKEAHAPKIYARHNRRFEVFFNQILQWKENKLLGDIFEVHITRNGFSRRNDWQTLKNFGGGQLLNWRPHIIDKSLRILGGSFESLYSDIKLAAAAGDCEDHIKIIFRRKLNRGNVNFQVYPTSTPTLPLKAGKALPQ